MNTSEFAFSKLYNTFDRPKTKQPVVGQSKIGSDFMQDNLSIFREIEIEKPVDIIIKQIRDLISSGKLKPGDRLPSERMLSERIGLGRTHVREAIKKLEFYGILKTLPQSGTVVAGIGITALEGLISNILKIETTDFASMVETRVILGVEAAKLAAERRTDKDLLIIKEALDKFHHVMLQGKSAVEEDFMFHMKIIEASRNPVIKSLLMLVIPQIIEYYNKMGVCTQGESSHAYKEHLLIFDAIEKQDVDGVEAIMNQHFTKILELTRTLK